MESTFNITNMDRHPVSLSPTNFATTTRSEQAIVLVLAAALLSALLHLYTDYKAFLALGPGGTPSTITGYVRTKTLSLFALRNPYLPNPATQREQGYLRQLPARVKPRPVTRGIAPHRQVTQRASPALYQRLAAELCALVTADPERLVLGTSCFEKHGTGLFSRSPVRRTCGGEICHAHPSDGSMHMTLHPADARVVLEAGWGERHPLARGGWFEKFVPEGFVMVYAPRGEEDVEVLLRIVEAGAWFVDQGLSKGNGADSCEDSAAMGDVQGFGIERTEGVGTAE
jgi:hypothetical protein